MGGERKQGSETRRKRFFKKTLVLWGGAKRTSPETPLDSPGSAARCSPLSPNLTMGQQYNKGIKKKRRLAYLKRKKEAAKVAAKKTSKAKK